MEALLEKVPERVCGLTWVRKGQAKKLLAEGFTPRQVGVRMSLDSEELKALAIIAEEIQGEPETEAQWDARMALLSKRKSVRAAHLALDRAVDFYETFDTLIDKDTMGTIEKASNITHKWFKSGEEQVKTAVEINFSALAQTEPEAQKNAPSVIDLEGPASVAVEGEDWLG